MDQNFGNRRPSRPRFSVSESESCLSNETQVTDFENIGILKSSPSSGFFMQRSASASTSGDHAHHLQQCENVIKSHHKLKVYFTVLFVVNVILIIVVIILIMFCVFFLMMARDAENKNNNDQNEQSPRSGTGMINSLCPMKCRDLTKYGFDIEVDKECCTLQDVVHEMKQYMDKVQSTYGRRSPQQGAQSSPLQSISKPAIHLVGGKPADQTEHNPHFVQGWHSDTRQKISFNSDFITIPDNGLYFTYSRIHFTIKQKDGSKLALNGVQMPVTHALYRRKVGGSIFLSIQDSSMKCPMQNDSSVVHSSYLEGIAYLKRGEEIKIGLTYGEKFEYDLTNKDNYFGMFKL